MVLSSLFFTKASSFRNLNSAFLKHQPCTRLLPTTFSTKARNNKKGGNDGAENKYSKTVLLPQTSFDQRANAIKKEPEIQKWWEENRIYEKLAETNPGDKFILHDGPPYANGELHTGHALNKMLKDFINRYQILQGRKVRYVPGWDCHGLPIELKVLQTIPSKERATLDVITLRKKAAAFAKQTMERQKESFQRFGVWGDFASPYLTLQPEYEAAQIGVFGEMVAKGHIYRGKKPVYWSPSSRTALAEAELEYPENHTSRSVYVAFELTSPSVALQSLLGKEAGKVVIWTTTPWTLPANLAVAVNANLQYCMIRHPAIAQNTPLLVAHGLVPTLKQKFGLPEGEEFVISGVINGSELVGTQYKHPLYPDQYAPIVIGGEYITTEAGTGLVHTAPGHGQEDYLTGLKYDLPLYSPVDEQGRFTDEVGPQFAGLEVLTAGNAAVIEALKQSGEGVLLAEEAYHHKYPYDWRTKKPVLVRATEQWFASVSRFREDALQAIDQVTWIPSVGRNRIYSMTESRGDWCISRQRAWGVPIPVFYDTTNGSVLLNPETLAHIQALFHQHGSDCWYTMSEEELLPSIYQTDAKAGRYRKGSDTMDVWFDSGTSWSGVLQTRSNEGLTFPADLYLEGSDQHRGWFQSSLLTSVACHGHAPYRAVLTHGFVLDEKGNKMSKSLGNVIDPWDVIQGTTGGKGSQASPGYGADILRLWVASVDYTNDVCIGLNILKQVSETYRKIRNTIRFMLGALNGFEPTQHTVPYHELPEVDKYVLGQLSTLLQEINTAYTEYAFFKAMQQLLTFVTNDLSAFYLDTSKDRLYISASQSIRRRACQTVLQQVVEQLSLAFAPVLPHLAEEVWQHLPYTKPTGSIFEQGYVGQPHNTRHQIYPAYQTEEWNALRDLKTEVNKVLEIARQAKFLGASAEAKVYLCASEVDSLQERLLRLQGDDGYYAQSKTGGNLVDDLRFLFLVSGVTILPTSQAVYAQCPEFNNKAALQGSQGIAIGIARAEGHKCQRCWLYCHSVASPGATTEGLDHHHHSGSGSDLCERCRHEISLDGHSLP